MTTLLLFSLPWGYLIAALFLLIAIILFIIAIFMKDTGTNAEGELQDDRYGQQEEAYETASYEDTFDRYQNVTDVEETEDTLQDMIAETSEDLAETRMFTPVMDIPEPDPYEEMVEPEEIKEEEAAEEVYEAPVSGFGAFAEPEEVTENVVDEDADVKRVEDVPEEVATEEVAPEEEAAPEEIYEAPEEEEFEEVVPPKKSLFGRTATKTEEDDVPKPVAKQKSGMSFAEEVRRLIEEEERRNKNS